LRPLRLGHAFKDCAGSSPDWKLISTFRHTGRDWEWRWSSLGGPCGAGFEALACGVQALGFAGAAGFTPKSHTYRFISFGLSISTSAYSPGCRSALGVIFTQPPGIVSTSAGTKFSF